MTATSRMELSLPVLCNAREVPVSHGTVGSRHPSDEQVHRLLQGSLARGGGAGPGEDRGVDGGAALVEVESIFRGSMEELVAMVGVLPR